MYKDSTFVDQNGSLTLSGGFQSVGCKVGDVREIDFGFNRNFTVA
jgi:hypothetical protein